MIAGRKLIIAVLGGLVLSVSVHADMTPVASLDSPSRPSVQTDEPADSRNNSGIASSLACLSVSGLDAAPLAFLPPDEADVEPAVEETPPCPVLTEGVDSFGLCLSALVGLGLCGAGRSVKKTSLGFIPDWYHHGGPYQIGSSQVVGPDCLCATAVSFVQPDGLPEDLSEQYHRGTIAPLLRKSQFVPTILASRGPPLLRRA